MPALPFLGVLGTASPPSPKACVLRARPCVVCVPFCVCVWEWRDVANRVGMECLA
jgi:hypothetical protein